MVEETGEETRRIPTPFLKSLATFLHLISHLFSREFTFDYFHFRRPDQDGAENITRSSSGQKDNIKLGRWSFFQSSRTPTCTQGAEWTSVLT